MNVAAVGLSPISTALQSVKESVHLFLPTVQTYSYQAFDQIKQKLWGQSPNLQFLLSKPDVTDSECQDRLADLLISSSPYGLEGHQLMMSMNGCEEGQRKAIIEKALEKCDHKYEDIARFIVCNDENWAELAQCLPQPQQEGKKSVRQEIQKTFRVVIRFFPNFLDNTLKAFSVLDSVKSPETLWDFSAVMDIYFKVFAMPHALFTVVGAVVAAPTSLFLITGGVILLAILGICLYLKYRPCPNHLPLSTNLTEEALKGNLEPVVGRDQEINRLCALLGKKEDGIHTNLFLVGPSGVGKTELVKGIAQRYHEKKIFALSAPELTGAYNSIGDKMRLLLLDIKDHNDEVILFIDEFGKAIKKGGSLDIAGLLNPLIGNGGVQVIVAATKGEYENHVAKEDALCARFARVDVHPTDEIQTLTILRSRMEHKGKYVRFEPGIEKVIYDQCLDKQLPRTAVQMLDLAINTVSAFNFESYVSESVLKLQAELMEKRNTYLRCPNQGLAHEIKQLVELEQEYRETDQAKIRLALETKKLIKMERELTRKRNALVHDPAKKEEALFLHNYTLSWLEQKIEQNLADLPVEFPMVVAKKVMGIVKDNSCPPAAL